MNITRALVAVVPMMVAFNVMAYETPTHFDLSAAAVRLSISDVTLQKLGLNPIAAQQTFPPDPDAAIRNADFGRAKTTTPNTAGCSVKAEYTSFDLVACGAMFEDDGLRSLNHFLDPQHLVGGKPRPLTNTAAFVLGSWNSADWVLADDPVFPPPDTVQKYSYKDARGYMYAALTTQGPEQVRKVQWGLMFQSLGEAIHHIQDMAQPQHTRNDSHADLFGGKDVYPLTNVSRYEKRALARVVENRLASYADSATPSYPAYATKLSSQRSFWYGSGTGMADFSSLNFITEGTNFRAINGDMLANAAFSSPVPAGAKDFTLAQLNSDPTFVPAPDSPFLLAQCGTDRSGCKVAMVKTAGIDPLTGAPLTNDYASTYSMFDQDLKAYDASATLTDPETGQVITTQQTFAFNHFNIDAAYKMLIPRAVSYSAGLLNYFFRGQLSVHAPDAGVLAIVDHAPADTIAGCGTPCGFRTVKLKLKNDTPYDDMSGGANGAKLVVIAKYHLNNCYQSDLSGEFGAPAYTGVACRSSDEAIAVSNPLSVASIGRDFATQPYVFTFAANKPIPINATDLQLQVVYRGQLGREVDAVAVTTIDVGEPTYLLLANHNDFQAVYNKDGSFALTQPYGAAGRYSLNLELRLNPSQATPIATSLLDPGFFHRIVVLTDQPSINYALTEQYVGAVADTQSLPLVVANNQTNYKGETINLPPYVPMRRTGGSTWAYESDLNWNSVHWLPGYGCLNGAGKCEAVDKTVQAVTQRYPPFKQATPRPMTINF